MKNVKISVSNIAWEKPLEKKILSYLSNKKYDAIEIAPTVIVKDNPYNNINIAKKYLKELQRKYNLSICSIQSIWYGKNGNIFNKNDVEELIKYTFKAIDYAQNIDCHNIVFGCPKNRNKYDINDSNKLAVDFFNRVCEYALSKNVVISIEPNPTIYNTNFINTTKEAIEFVKIINKSSFKINVDFGTIIENQEDLDVIYDNIDLINHIHISEPNLEKIKKRDIHRIFIEKMLKLGYNNYFSIEMKKTENVMDLIEVIDYLEEIRNEVQ